MKKRITLILVIVLVLGVLATGIWWYVRRNQGSRLLGRVELALRASQYDRALDLGTDYVRQYPQEWQGHYDCGRALMYLGRFDEARQPLQKATVISPSRAAGWMLLADTYALPARKSLSDPRTKEQTKSLQKAIDGLQQAGKIIADAPPAGAEKDALDLREYTGLNLLHMAGAWEELAARLENETQDANAAKAANAISFQKARDILLEVVRRDVSRDDPAAELLAMCQERKDPLGLEAARAAIYVVDEANRPPRAAARLTLADVFSLPPGSKARKDEASQAARRLDQLIARYPDRTDVLLARAEVALEQSDANTAESLCQKALRTSAQNPRALFLEARILVQRGQLPEAETKLYQLTSQTRRWDDAWVLFGSVLSELGKKDAARNAMLQAVSVNPANARALRELVRWSLRDKRYREACNHASALYGADPNDGENVRLLAGAAREANDVGLAKAVLEEVRRKHADQPEILVVVATGYYLLRDAEQYRQTIEQAAAAPSQTEAGRLARAEAMAITNRSTQATALLESLAAEQPKSAGAQAALAGAFWRGGRRMDALEHYRKAAALEEQNVVYRLQLAKALLDIGMVDDSLLECQKVLDPKTGLEPNNPSALSLKWQAELIRGEASDGTVPALPQGASGLPLAQVYLNRGQVDKCIEICQAELARLPLAPDPNEASFAGDPNAWPGGAARMMSPEVQSLHMLLAQAYLRAGQKDKSLEEWKVLLRANPERLDIYRRIAGIWLQGKPLSDANVETALRALPEARAYLVDLTVGGFQFSLKKYDAAAASGQRAASGEGAPDSVRGQGHILAAISLKEANRPEQALAELDALSAVKGWHGRAMLGKADLLHAIRRSVEAKGVLDGLRKGVGSAGEPWALQPIAEAYARIGSLQDALSVCDDIEKSMPNDARPCLIRASVLWGAGQAAQAQEWCRKAVERSPENLSAHRALAASLENSQDIFGALEALRKMASVATWARTTSLWMQANVYFRQGLYAPAVQCLKDLSAEGFAEDPQVRLALGRAFASLGRRQEAAETVQAVEPNNAHYLTAQLLLASLAQTDEAKLAILGRVAQDEPNLAAILPQQMAILLRSNRAREAADLFERSASVRPAGEPLPDILAPLAVQALFESGKRREAGELCSRMARDTGQPPWRWTAALLLLDQAPPAARALLPDPNAATPLDALVGVVLCRGDIAAAKAWQSRAEPNANPTAGAKIPPLYRALSLLAIGDVAGAEACLAEIRVGPSLANDAATQLVALVKADANASLLASDLLRTILAAPLAPYAARAWALEILRSRPDCLWAGATVLLTQPDEATLKAVLDRVPPDSPTALEIRAALLFQQKKFAEAAETYGQLARAHKDDLDLAIRQGGVLEMAGKYEEALSVYREVAKATTNPQAANNAASLIADLYPKDAARLNEANALANQAVAAQPTVPHFRDTKGWIAYLLGQYDTARQELRRAAPALAGSPEVHYHLGLAEAKGGSMEMARLHLEAAVALSKDLPPDQAASLSPAEIRAGQRAQEALKTLEPPKP